LPFLPWYFPSPIIILILILILLLLLLLLFSHYYYLLETRRNGSLIILHKNNKQELNTVVLVRGVGYYEFGAWICCIQLPTDDDDDDMGNAWSGGGVGRSQLLPQNSIASECKWLYVPMAWAFTTLHNLLEDKENSFIHLSSLWQMDGSINPKIDKCENFFGCHLQAIYKKKTTSVPSFFLLLLLLFLLIPDYKEPPSCTHHQCIM
jgi:hypothetical protein